MWLNLRQQSFIALVNPPLFVPPLTVSLLLGVVRTKSLFLMRKLRFSCRLPIPYTDIGIRSRCGNFLFSIHVKRGFGFRMATK